jgi:hypothetical protein
MSFYGMLIVFVFFIAVIYLGAFFAEMRYENTISLAFEKCSSAIETMSYLSVANLSGADQAYVNYTLEADRIRVGTNS